MRSFFSMKSNITSRSRSKSLSNYRQRAFNGNTKGLRRIFRRPSTSRSSSVRSSSSKSRSVRSRSVSRSSPLRQRNLSGSYRMVYRAASARPFSPSPVRSRQSSIASFVNAIRTTSPARSRSSSSSSPYVTFSRTPARVVIPPTPSKSPSPARSRSASSPTPRTLVFNL